MLFAGAFKLEMVQSSELHQLQLKSSLKVFLVVLRLQCHENLGWIRAVVVEMNKSTKQEEQK